MGELRCPSRLHGKLHEGLLEVKCHSKRCGAGSGVIVFHYFDPITEELIDTKRYQDPAVLAHTNTQKEKSLTWP